MAKRMIDDRRLGVAEAYFRDEMRRAVAWRSRLDRTSNWAVVLTATLLTWAFTKPENPHFVILVAMLTVTFFLFLEANRYRRYDVWRSRLRLIEGEVFAAVFEGREECEGDAWQRLAADLVTPSFKVPFPEALQRRLRRVYAALLSLLFLAWFLKVGAFGADEPLLDRVRIGLVPGWAVMTGVGIYAGSLFLLLVWPITRRAMEGLADHHTHSDEWQEDEDHRGALRRDSDDG